MSKMSKAIVALGVVAGLGVAALPLSSYAAGNTDSKNATVQVEVGGGISLTIVDPITPQTSAATKPLDLATRTLDLGEAKLGGDIVTGILGVQVSTNDPSGYTLKMTSASASTAMTGAAGEIPAGTPTKNGANSAWGYSVIKNPTSTTVDPSTVTWSALTADGADIYDSTNAGATVKGEGASEATQQTDIMFGVNASATQAEGTYSTQVTFTATVK